MSGFNEKFPKQMSLVSHYPRRTDPSPSFNVPNTNILKIENTFYISGKQASYGNFRLLLHFYEFLLVVQWWSASHVKLIFWCKSVMAASITTTAKGKLFTWRDIFQQRLTKRCETTTIDWSWKAKPGHNTANWFSPRPWRLYFQSIANVVVVASRTNSNLEPINLKRHHSQLCQLWSCFNPEEEAKEGKSL